LQQVCKTFSFWIFSILYRYC